MNYDNVVTDEPAKTESEKQKITLFDNSGALKLSLNPENLYYIESDDNYIKVWYTDSKGELKQYILRCRLKTVEEDFKGSPLVRCHRKYIVNLNKVSMLRKESDGYVLDLQNEAIPPISVTKTYTDAVLSHFTEQSPLLEPMDDESFSTATGSESTLLNFWTKFSLSFATQIMVVAVRLFTTYRCAQSPLSWS